jgi:type II secretory pathway component PulF
MKKNFRSIIIFSLTLLPTLVLAQTYNNPITLTSGGTPIDTIPKFLLALVDGFIAVMTPIIVVFIIYAGFLFVTARGDSKQIETAKFVILWCLIGALIMLGAKIIASAIRETVLSLGSS